MPRLVLAALALAAVLGVHGTPASTPTLAHTARVAFLQGGNVVVVDLETGTQRVVLRHAGNGPVHWSGDGRLVSSGGRVEKGPAFSTDELKWAPTGETAAFLTRAGAVVTWSPSGGRRTILPASWGARSLAWGSRGELVLARYVCRAPCGIPRHQEVWIWHAGRLRRVAGPLPGVVLPIAAGLAPDGRALWWADIQASGSIAADGIWLYANRAPVARTLVFPDYVVVCGAHLALAAGGDRYAMHGKRILFDGRDFSRDPSRSWVSPSCSEDGRLVAAASRNTVPPTIGNEHRSIWQLRPTRKQLTRPPAGWTDENPHVLADSSILFVRTHQTSRKLNGSWYVTEHGKLQRLAGGKLAAVADVTFTVNELRPLSYEPNYYGHYGWPWRVVAAP